MSDAPLALPARTQAEGRTGGWPAAAARWRGQGWNRLADTLAAKIPRLAASRPPEQIEAALEAIEGVAGEDPACAAAVAERLEHLLDTVDGRGLARWVLTGMRRHALEPHRLRAYFRLEDAQAVEALHAEAGAADLDASLPSLALLLQGLAEREVRVQGLHQFALNAPPARPVLTARHLLIPDSYTALDGDDRGLLYRAAVAHAFGHLRYSPSAQPVGSLKPMGIAIVSAIEDARIERLLMSEFPGMRSWFLPFHATLPEAPDLSFAALVRRMSRALADQAASDDNYWVNKARRLFEAQAGTDLQDHAAFRSVASILANDLGQMRVRFDPQRYAVHPAYRDDNSFLWDFGDHGTPPPQAHELEVRSQGARIERQLSDASGSEAAAETREKEVELSRHAYPEWDYRIGHLRTDWCTVVEKLPAGALSGEITGFDASRRLPGLDVALRRRVLSRARRLRRQHEGDTIDLDAAIEVLIDRQMKLAPETRLFMRPGSEALRSSILVLLDLSESTNDPVAGSARSVLDIEKEAALLLSRTLSAGPDRLAVHGFSSDTRHQVNYYRLLEFGVPFAEASARPVRQARARYSTRIGAAVRHATACVSQEASQRRAVLVVTDGAPSDVDVFDRRYLVEDARAAVLEARRVGVEVHGVAIDPVAEPYAQRIFGWRGYRIVDDAALLPSHLQRVCAQLARA